MVDRLTLVQFPYAEDCINQLFIIKLRQMLLRSPHCLVLYPTKQLGIEVLLSNIALGGQF